MDLGAKRPQALHRPVVELAGQAAALGKHRVGERVRARALAPAAPQPLAAPAGEGARTLLGSARCHRSCLLTCEGVARLGPKPSGGHARFQTTYYLGLLRLY
jgi:hypothetical protein